MESSIAENPLPPCPSMPNCLRATRTVDATPAALFRAAQHALADLAPVSLHVQPAARRAHAVYRVAGFFKDDVDVLVVPHGETGDRSMLHIRSASRVGKNDLGVNRRRVDRFFHHLSAAL